MFNQKFKIANFEISKNSKPLIIAEIGINHEGNFNQCIRMILRAKNSGANLVKLQIVDPGENYKKNTDSYKIFKKAMLSDEEIFKLYAFSKKNKINLFSTFDKKKFEFFNKISQPCYKISSSQIYDYFFIKQILKKNKPVILSTGVADISDLDVLLNLIKNEKNKKIVILQCRSIYPTPLREINLSRLTYIQNKYKVICGYSDHCRGIDVSALSIHYGAKLIEKHFTLNKKKRGYDHNISANSNDLKMLSNCINKNYKIYGNPNYELFDEIKKSSSLKKIIRRFQLIRNIKKDSKLKKDDFKLIRTSNVKNFTKFNQIFFLILKKKIKKNLKKGSFLSLKDFVK